MNDTVEPQAIPPTHPNLFPTHSPTIQIKIFATHDRWTNGPMKTAMKPADQMNTTDYVDPYATLTNQKSVTGLTSTAEITIFITTYNPISI